MIVVDHPLATAAGIGCAANRTAAVLLAKPTLPFGFADAIEAQCPAPLPEPYAFGIAGIFPAGRADRLAHSCHIL
jgi:hypothetical protein